MKPWLLAILRNVCNAEFARRGKEEVPTDFAQDESVEEEMPMWQERQASPEKMIVLRQDTATIRRLVAELPEPSAAKKRKALCGQIDHRGGDVDSAVEPRLDGVLVAGFDIHQMTGLQRTDMRRNNFVGDRLRLIVAAWRAPAPRCGQHGTRDMTVPIGTPATWAIS